MSSADQRPVAVCVLGMHRSGTSVLARLLNLLGVELGSDLLEANFDNRKGFWEHRKIVELHTAILDSIGSSYFDDFFPLPDDWHQRPQVQPFRQRLVELLRQEFAAKPLWGFKDPRTCRMLAMWHGILQELAVDARFVLTIRPPREIVDSISQRNGQPWNKTLLLTLVHMLQAERATRGLPRVVVTYDQIMGDWWSTALWINSKLNVKWPHAPETIAAQVSQFLDPSLRHFKSDSFNLDLADPHIARWTTDAYQILAAAASNDSGTIDEMALDRISAEFAAEQPRLAAWRPAWSTEERLRQTHIWTQQMEAEIRRLTKENQDLRHEMATRPMLAEAMSQLEIVQADAKKAQAIADASEQRAIAAEQRAVSAEAQLREIQQSKSWKITAPLRTLRTRPDRRRGKPS